MKPSLCLTAVLLAAASSAAQNAQLIDDARLEQAGMYRYWQADLPLTDGDRIETGYLVDDALYVVTVAGTVFALQAEVGLIRWADKVTVPDYTIFPPSHIKTEKGTGPVVIPTTTRVFIYDRYSGDLFQSFAPRFAPGSGAAGIDNSLYFGGSDGRVHCLLLDRTGRTMPIERWTVQTSGPVTGAPVLFDPTTLYFASHSGSVYACGAQDKALYWSYATGGPIPSDLVVSETAVYVASMDRSVYKLDRVTGGLAWRFLLPKPLDAAPIVAAGLVYQFCPGQGIVAIDADTGSQRWRVAEAQAFASHTAGGDFLLTYDRRLILVDRKTGTVKHTIEADGVLGTVVNTRNDAIYALGSDGRVLCARLDSVPYLRRQQVLAAQAQLNKPPRRAPSAAPKRGEAKQNARNPLANDPFRSRNDVRP